MKYRTILTVLLCLTCTSRAQEGKLPDAAQQLVDRLAQWELEQKALLQQRTDSKRADVIALLQKYLVDATKAGDLDGALAIKEKITALTPKEIETPIPDAPDASNLIVGKWTYRVIKGGQAGQTKILEFLTDGTAKLDNRKPSTWEFVKGSWQIKWDTGISYTISHPVDEQATVVESTGQTGVMTRK